MLFFRSIGGSVLVGALAKDETVKPAVEAVWEIATSLLVSVAISTLALDIIVVIGAWLAGPNAWATSLRQVAAPCVRQQPAANYGAGAVLFLIAWGPIAAVQKPLGILVFAIFFAAGLELLARQSQREFPDAERGDGGDQLRQTFRGRRPAATASPDPSAVAVGELERLSSTHRGGELSDAEFAAAKAQLFGSSGGPANASALRGLRASSPAPSPSRSGEDQGGARRTADARGRPVDVHGEELAFIFDTGPAQTQVTDKFAEQFGLKRGGKTRTCHRNRLHQQSPRREIDNWSIAGHALPASTIEASTLKLSPPFAGRSADGAHGFFVHPHWTRL